MSAWKILILSLVVHQLILILLTTDKYAIITKLMHRVAVGPVNLGVKPTQNPVGDVMNLSVKSSTPTTVLMTRTKFCLVSAVVAWQTPTLTPMVSLTVMMLAPLIHKRLLWAAERVRAESTLWTRTRTV